MNNRFSAFVYRTRGLYMFIALVISMVLKSHLHGTTSLLFFIVGVIIIVVVQALRMYSASYLWGRQAVTKPEADFLCASGPYAYTRNPLYLGNFIIGTGVCLTINEWYAYALFTISYAFVYSIVMPYEEKFLQERFGNVYLAYKIHTGRLMPRIKSYKGGEKVIPNYKAGILGEIHVPIILALIFIIIYRLFVK